VTDIGTYRRCRRKWDYSSNARRNLMRVGSGPEALELGGLIHRALADWMTVTDFDKVQLHDIFTLHAHARQNEITNKYKEVTKRDIPDVHLQAFLNVIGLGKQMMINYQDFHKTPVPKNMKFASPEQEIEIPIPDTEHTCTKCFVKYEDGTLTHTYRNFASYRKANPVGCAECGDTGIARHYLTMTLDGFLIDNKDWLWVLEHKTYKNRPRPIDLYMNDQFTKYAWGASQLGIGRVRGIAYDGMAKKEKPTYTVEDGSRRKQTMEDLFLRKTIEKGPEELEQAGIQLAKEINEMANDPVIYPNVPWQGCMTEKCAFIDICRMQQVGEDPTRLLQLDFTPREIVRGGQRTDED
jgi:hypothetical protein